MKWRQAVLVVVPALCGLVIAALVFTLPSLANPILHARIDLGTLVAIAGVGLTVLLATVLSVWKRSARRGRAQMVELRNEAAAERRRFLQRLDHELKNPLTAIRAGLANLANGADDSYRTEASASVDVQVLRLSRLTADLRKLAELETRSLERTPVDVTELLQEVVALAQEQPGADNRDLALTLPHAPWPVPQVLGDWDLLFLAIHNLLDNALKFSGPGDTVEVRAFDDRAFVIVEVADTGPGIPDAELPRVWEDLYRGQGARGVPGSGLGLALTRTILERHGGQVQLRSRAGQGTVVTLRLPVA